MPTATTTTSMPVRQQRLVEAEPRLAGVEVEADQADGEAEEERDEAAQRRSAEHAGDHDHRQHHEGEVGRGADLDRHRRQRRGEEHDEERADRAGDEGADRRGGERLRGPSGPCHEVALEGRHHRRGLARCVEQDRGRRAAVHAAVVDAGEHDEGRDRLEAVGHGQQQRHRHGRADARQDADEGAEEHADDGVEQVLRGEDGREAVHEQAEVLHQSTPSRIPAGRMTPRPSWKKYQLADGEHEADDDVTHERAAPEGPRRSDEQQRPAHGPAEERDRQDGEEQHADQLEDGRPVGGVAQVDVLAALGLGHVAAQGGDHQQDAEQHGDGADDVGEDPRTDRVAEADAQRGGLLRRCRRRRRPAARRGRAGRGHGRDRCVARGDPGWSGVSSDVLTAGPAPRGWWRRARPAPGGTS